MQELERSDTVNGVRAVEELNPRSVGNPQVDVKPLDLGELAGDAVVGGDAVVMATLDHEWARSDQAGHLAVVEGHAEIELEDLVLRRSDVRVRASRGSVLPNPIVEVGEQMERAYCGTTAGMRIALFPP